MKKSIISTLLIIGGILILFSLYVYIFVIWRPFMGEITEGKPIMGILCNLQDNCHVGIGLYQCYSVRHANYIINEKLSKWKEYHGCNESTSGFYEREDGYKGIYVEGCGCGGLM